MPRTSKRKAGAPPVNASSVPTPAGSRSVSGKSNKQDAKRKADLFDKYANCSLGMIDPEGIEALCADVGVDYTDVKILMLAWKLKAQKQGYFTQEEWRTGMKALRVDSLEKLKSSLSELELEVGKPENFEDFYSFAFRYCLTEEKQKVVDVETICELLNLVLGCQFRSTVDSLTEYLKIQNDYKGLNKDQWMSFLRFCREISFPDLKNYDPALAWPLILDNFVDWMKETHG